MMVYKIGLISTHGTGKTALAGLIVGELKRRGISAIALKEMSTAAKERGLPINEQTTPETQLWILHRQFAEELLYSQERLGQQYQVIICDRGPDNYCYLKHRFGDDPYALQLVLGHLQKFPYAKLYFLPIIDAIIAQDGLRAINPEFQRIMDTEIRSFIATHSISCAELPVPQQEDAFRNEWVKIIVNQTLQDLDIAQQYWM